MNAWGMWQPQLWKLVIVCYDKCYDLKGKLAQKRVTPKWPFYEVRNVKGDDMLFSSLGVEKHSGINQNKRPKCEK